MLYSWGMLQFSPCQMDILLCLTFPTISTLVRQLSTVFVFWFFKVACVVKIKLFFSDWLYYNLTILIKECKVSYKNLDEALLFSKNHVFCLKIWWAPTTLQFNIFCWNFAHVSYLPMSTKGCVDFFYSV